ncbi:unnamed protein product [marine sediment metagenome]|uniref:Uncharacterized protein n=1 Tax=marine sediment metagenome TaxID=412755 RepID=X1G9Z4_9ZZZZ
MGKYVYVSYMSTVPELNPEIFLEKILPRLENEDIKIIARGVAIGVPEGFCIVYETDLDVKEFIDFRVDAFTVDGKNMIDHTTTMVIINEKDIFSRNL